MFKLVKIRNAGFCTPDLIEARVKVSMEYFPGHLYYYEDHRAVFPATMSTARLFMCVEHLKTSDYNATVKGFLVTPNMLFETYDGGGERFPMIGERVRLVYTDKSGGYEILLEDDSESPIILEKIDEYIPGAKVLVSMKMKEKEETT